MSEHDHAGLVLDGRYRLILKVAEGGMGAVYQAEHLAVGRRVAVKMLRPQLTLVDSMVKRFYREAQAAAAIKHPGIVDIFDVGVSPGGEPYLVMEYLEGESLAAVLGRVKRLDLEATIELCEGVLPALEAAHQAGVVHRDLKPENILLVNHGDGERPQIKLIDFGVSKLLRAETEHRLTKTGAVLGTVDYMAPEQARGADDVGPPADIFSMGVILYEALSGALPFAGRSYAETISQLLTEPPLPPREAYARFPVAAEPLVLRALAREPTDRWGTARALLDAVRALRDVDGRGQGLDWYTRDPGPRGLVVGDLGGLDPPPNSDSPTRVLEEIVRQRTPERWSQATTLPHPAALRSRSRRRRIYLIVAFGAAALIGLILGLVTMTLRPLPPVVPVTTNAPARPAAPVLPAPAPADDGVLLTVTDLPAGGRIYWDGALVPDNPFRVSRRDTLFTLRLEADGYEPMAFAVTPRRDQTFSGTVLKRLPARGPGAAPTRREVAPEVARGRDLAVIDAKKPQLKRCYDDALARAEVPRDLDLFVDVRLALTAGGVVREATVSGNVTNYAALLRCVSVALKATFFASADAPRDVAHSFVFTTRP